MTDTTGLRDRVIDWMFLHSPQLLVDDRLTDGIVCLVLREVRRCVAEQAPEDRDAILRMQWEGCPNCNKDDE